MYINFHKFNYDTVPTGERKNYEDRDKEAYKKVLSDCFNQNLDSFVERKWEIKEIHYLKQISDFIKPVREAESLYELGFYTSCIALVGVAAEDFSKYLSLINSIPIPNNESQFTRVGNQLSAGIIDQTTHDLFQEIRRIRNDCLHYNQNFKQKSTNDLKADAIKSLNNLKEILKSNKGTILRPEDFTELLEELFANENTRNFEEIIWKQKNMFSHLFHFSTTQDPSVKTFEKANIYLVSDIDEDEITLRENVGIKLVVYVDLDDTGRKLIEKHGIKNGDYIFAVVSSEVAYDGQTREWFLKEAQKLAFTKNPFE